MTHRHAIHGLASLTLAAAMSYGQASADSGLHPGFRLIPPPPRAELAPVVPDPDAELLPDPVQAVTGRAVALGGGKLRMRWVNPAAITEDVPSVLRLWGVDMPGQTETCWRTYAGSRSGRVLWRCGDEARNALRNYIGVRPIRCIYRGSAVGAGYECFLPNEVAPEYGLSINRWLVQHGWAYAGQVEAVLGTVETPFIAEQNQALNYAVGVWNARAPDPVTGAADYGVRP